MIMNRTTIYLALLVILITPLAAQAQAPDGSRLVIIISVDQMKSEFIDWYGNNWNGGLKRMFDEGVVYTNAILDYAASETGPGHATLSTGSFPRTHGIYGNEWTDPLTRRDVYCVEDSTALPVDGKGGKRSPRNLVVPALGDWLKKSSPSSKVISISIKDRAAILMGGKHPDQAYWYDSRSGHLVTSSYYASTSDRWVKEFNAANWVYRNVPPSWNKMMGDELYLGPDDQPGERPWAGDRTFPHPFTLAERASQMVSSPWGNAFLLDAARAAIKEEKLGQQGRVDLLFIGLSSTDYIGHSFGPNSHEMQDNLVRLDGALGSFIADLESTLGPDKLLIGLSADHACLPLPEYTIDVEHRQSRRLKLNEEIIPKIAEVDSLLRAEWGIDERLYDRKGFLNYAAAKAKGVAETTLEQRFREGMVAIDGIADVYFRRELVNTSASGNPFRDRFSRSHYAPKGDDFYIRFDENGLPTNYTTGTSHGSVYDYDNRIPLLVWGTHSSVNRIAARAVLADLAPTIAALLGIPYPKNVDGTPLPAVVGR